VGFVGHFRSCVAELCAFFGVWPEQIKDYAIGAEVSDDADDATIFGITHRAVCLSQRYIRPFSVASATYLNHPLVRLFRFSESKCFLEPLAARA
jgi:hypothetical protein